jgi:hypothetical protein
VGGTKTQGYISLLKAYSSARLSDHAPLCTHIEDNLPIVEFSINGVLTLAYYAPIWTKGAHSAGFSGYSVRS